MARYRFFGLMLDCLVDVLVEEGVLGVDDGVRERVPRLQGGGALAHAGRVPEHEGVGRHALVDQASDRCLLGDLKGGD